MQRATTREATAALAVAQPVRQGQHPLAVRHAGQDVVDEMGRFFRHPPAVAARAHAADLAREGHEPVVAAVLAAETAKTLGQLPAIQVAQHRPPHERRQPDIFAEPFGHERYGGGKPGADDAVEVAGLRGAAPVGEGAAVGHDAPRQGTACSRGIRPLAGFPDRAAPRLGSRDPESGDVTTASPHRTS